MAPRKMVKNKEAEIKSVYTDPASAGGFAGAETLYQSVHASHPNITRKDVERFLEKSCTYTLFKPSRNRFQRLRTVPSGFMSDVQADLADFQQLASANNGNRFLLLAVDVLSKRFFGVPVKSKSPTHMIPAFDVLFEQMPMLPKRLFTDRGLEFESRKMKEYFQGKHIVKMAAQNVETKASIAERGIQTFKNRVYKWFSEKNRTDWTNVLPQILGAINHSRSRVTGISPMQIDKRNAQEIFQKVWGADKEKMMDDLRRAGPQRKVNAGDMVRKVEPRQVFDKGYFPRNSDMIYRVNRVHASNPSRYTLVDWEGKGKEVKKKFYRPQIVKLHRDADTSYRVDKVLQQRKVKGKKQFLVTYIGYPGQEEWINESNFV